MPDEKSARNRVCHRDWAVITGVPTGQLIIREVAQAGWQQTWPTRCVQLSGYSRRRPPSASQSSWTGAAPPRFLLNGSIKLHFHSSRRVVR